MKKMVLLTVALAACGSGSNTGAVGSGGRPGSGGAAVGTGGTASGDRTGSGGAATGGSGTGGSATGGAASGGMTGSGGAIEGATGGTTGSGGATSDGGVDGPPRSGGRGGAATGGVGGVGGRGGGTSGAGGAAGGGGTAPFMPCPVTGNCKIMPLGDSITQGSGSTESGSYRVDLFRQSLTNGKHITFVGRQMHGPVNVVVGGVSTAFPRTHEGYSGYTIDNGGGRTGISTLVDDALTMFTPHVVLLMIGTNDVNLSLDLGNAGTRLGALMDRITTGAPNALLIVAKIVPTRTAATNTRVETYNNGITGLVQSRVAAGKHIALVDMYAAFTANSNYATALLTDELHPNDAGYVVMATTWYNAIKNYLP